MELRYIKDKGFYGDVLATGCSNSIKVKDLDFRVPCGKCLQCQKKRRSDWSLRLEDEYYSSDSAYFITLTYNDISIPRTETGYGTLNKKHVQDYIKRLRNKQVKLVREMYDCKANEVYKYIKPLRYYAVGEYGSKTRRPHYHILLFNLEQSLMDQMQMQWVNKQTKISYGHVDIGSVTGASINYVTKYMFKPFGKNDERTKPFSLMSKGRKVSGERKAQGVKEYGIIGYNYIKTYGNYHTDNSDLTRADYKGNVRRLPRAYLRRIFTKNERVLNEKTLEFEMKEVPDKELIQTLSEENYLKHLDQKIQDYEDNINKHYKGDQLDYIKSKEQDYKRKLETINNSETL